MRLSEILNEAKSEVFSIRWGKGMLDLRVWINPTASDMLSLGKKFSLRGLTDQEGNIYVWEATNGAHSIVLQTLAKHEIAFVNGDHLGNLHFFVHKHGTDLPSEWSKWGKSVACRDGVDIRLDHTRIEKIPQNRRFEAIVQKFNKVVDKPKVEV